MTVPVVLIAAVGRNGAIGVADGLPWRLPADLRQFKAETMGKPVIMGRKTFASLGRPLLGRHLVVVSRDSALVLPAGVVGATGIDEALARAQAIAAERGADEVMVAGGAEIYRAVLPFADALRITEVDLSPEADTYFPSINLEQWCETYRELGRSESLSEPNFSFVNLRKQRAL